MILNTVCGLVGASKGGGVPEQSVNFTESSSQFLSMPISDFGSYDRAKFAISTWIKPKDTDSRRAIFEHGIYPTTYAFSLYVYSGNLIFRASYNGTSTPVLMLTSGTVLANTDYNHILIHYDSANATQSLRFRFWINGVNPSLSISNYPSTPVFDSSGDVKVGRDTYDNTYADSLIYQNSFFSGTLPSINDLYDSGVPKSVIGLAGLRSSLDVAGGDVTHDAILATDWTNNNTATASSTIP